MKQQTFSDIEYSGRRKKTKRDEFLEIMNEIIPWDEWAAHIEPHYYSGKRGRPPLGIEKMLRMYLLQIWFTLSDEGVEDAIYDSYAMRKFMGIDFMVEQVPDATTLLHFRRLIEESGLGKAFFEAINRCLEKCGHIMKGGTIVDATLINAPSSTKNSTGSRDPEMRQTKKGNQWYFGMKCHMGVDAGTGYIHSIGATAANVHDIAEAAKLIRPDDEVVYGDAGYLGLDKRPEIIEDENKSKIDYRINQRPGKAHKMAEGPAREWFCQMERRKSSVRAKVEHAFHIIKNTFGFNKVSYRGIAKNLNRLYLLAASANLLMCARSGGWREQLV